MVPTEASPDQSKIHGLLSKFTSHFKQFQTQTQNLLKVITTGIHLQIQVDSKSVTIKPIYQQLNAINGKKKTFAGKRKRLELLMDKQVSCIH